MTSGVWAVVVAAGEGRRFGAPKQFAELGGRSVLDHAVDACRAVAEAVVVVLPDGATDDGGADRVATGGATRSASVRAGLDLVADDAEVVVVHDAARPLASAALFEAVVAAVRGGADGAVPALPVPDTLKRVVDGVVVETVPRDGMWAVQTPQAFAAAALRRAHANGGEATDDAGLVEANGGRVVVVPGEETNRKITVPADLERARQAVAP